MKVSHRIPGLSISRDDCGNLTCILSNRTGGFLMLSEPAISKYSGLFVNDGFDQYRILENIRLEKGNIIEVENSLSQVKRKYDSNSEIIEYPEGINGIAYSLSKKERIIIDFDCRKVHDLRDFGRHYKIDVEKSRIIISFEKKTDWRDDKSEDVHEFDLFVAIQPKSFVPEKDYYHVNQWIETYFSYDHRRKDSPSHRYSYRPFIISAKELLIAAGSTKEAALKELEKLKKYKPKKKAFRSVKADKEIAAAFVCAQNSLDGLKTKSEGVTRLFAGYPWFFQLWSRDENISLGALIKMDDFKTVKSILFEYLKNISKDGRLPNHIPSPHLGSSDGVGWFWKRVGDFISELKTKGVLEKYISPVEMKKIKETLELSIQRIEKNYKKDDMIISNAKESWMDTTWDNQDTREGFCIEIQALHLNMLRLAHELSGEKRFLVLENKLRKNVIKNFWNNSALADMAGDFTQRPNIFIAYYVYPELLSRHEWQTAFGSALDSLWLDWGGLTTIDKKHPWFANEYSGKDNQSYHRGDSWFWINNLAALCMFRNNAIDFEKNIKKIIDASTGEMLWQGAIGHSAEVSSAKERSSFGCFAQAWSASMFIELMLEVYKNEK